MIAFALAFFGFLLIASPMVLALLAGVDPDDEGGIINWLMSQSLKNIMLIRAMMLSGSGFIWAGAIVYYLPS